MSAWLVCLELKGEQFNAAGALANIGEQQNSAFFDPPQLKANVGDSVEFNFLAGESWIIRGDFDTPCVPYDYISSSGTGFSSGPIYLNDDDVQVTKAHPYSVVSNCILIEIS